MKRWLTGLAIVLLLVATGLTAVWFAIGPHGVALRLLRHLDAKAELGNIVFISKNEIRLDGLVLHTADWDARAEHVQARFSLLNLLLSNITIATASIDSAVITVHPSTRHEASAVHLPHLDAQSVRAATTTLVINGEPLTIEQLRTELHMRDTTLLLSGLSLGLRTQRTPIAQLAGRIQIDFNAPLQLHSELTLTRADSAGDLVLAGTPATLVAQLHLHRPLDQRIDLQLRKVGADWHLYGNTSALTLGNVTLAASSADLTLHGPALPLRVGATYHEQRVGIVILNAQGNLTTRAITLAGDLNVRETKLQLRALTLLSPWQVTVDIDGDNVDLARLFTGTSSRLTVQGHLQASAVDGRPQATLSAQANGLLLARRVNAALAARFSEAGTELLRATLDAPGNHVSASGTWQRGISYKLNLTQLAQLSPELAGNLQGEGTLSHVDFALDLRGSNVRFGRGIAITSLNAQGKGDFSRRIDLNAHVTGLRVPGLPPTDADLTINGAARDHVVHLSGHNHDGQIDLAGRGTLTADQWRAQLLRVSALLTNKQLTNKQLTNKQLTDKQLTDNGSWSNNAPMQFGVSSRTVSLTGCLEGPDAAQLCIVDGRYQLGSGSRVGTLFGAAHARGLRLQQLPLPSAVAGQVSGALTIDAVANGSNVDLQAVISSGEVRGARAPIGFNAHGTGHIPLLTTEPWRMTAIANGAAFGTIAVDGERTNDGRIKGHISGDVPDIGAVQTLLMAADQVRLRGPGKIDLQVTGSDSAPVFAGTGNVRGTVLIPALSSAPLSLRVDLQGESGVLAIHGTLQAGDGLLRGDGQLKFVSNDAVGMQPSLQLKLTGTNAHLLNHTDLSAFVAPDLDLAFANRHLTIGGNVLVEKADVHFTAVQDQDAGLSDDVVIHRTGIVSDERQQNSTTDMAALPVDADVRVTLGNNVRFTAAGLNTRLTGAVQLRTTPSKPLRLLGHVDAADGTFSAYGVKLAIERGRLDFNGPVDNPQVNVRAIRKLQEGTTDKVGVLVSGPLQRLNTQLFSEPPRAQTAALAYLITGKPLDLASSGELAKVNGAGVALGVVGLLPQTAQLRDRIGLDELEVSAPLSPAQSAIVIGKQLTNRLRARYSYSVFNRTGGVQLRYRITDNITLQTEAGAQIKAVDVLWEWQSKTPTAALDSIHDNGKQR